MLGEGEKKPLKLPRNEYFTFIAYYSSLLSLARMITANWGIEIKLSLSTLVLKNNSQMPNPEWHAGNSTTHLVNIKLDFVCYKQAAVKAPIEN